MDDRSEAGAYSSILACMCSIVASMFSTEVLSSRTPTSTDVTSACEASCMKFIAYREVMLGQNRKLAGLPLYLRRLVGQ